MRPGASGLFSGTVESVPDWECGHFLPLQPAGEQPCADCWSPDTTPPRPYVLNKPCSQLSAGIFCFTDRPHRPGAPCPCAPLPTSLCQARGRLGQEDPSRTLFFSLLPSFQGLPMAPHGCSSLLASCNPMFSWGGVLVGGRLWSLDASASYLN